MAALNIALACLAVLSCALMLWQWAVALRFPLHHRIANGTFAPALTLLKPLKGCDDATEECLRSWFTQVYVGPVQIIFGVASAQDPVCEIVRKLQTEFPAADAQLLVCGTLLGTNLKVSKLLEMERHAKHELLVISDADVRVPADFLANAAAPLQKPEVGLVNCFYRLANPQNLAMKWEAVAINVDFWSQVLQSQSLKPPDFALGAVMVTRRKQLQQAGGFEALVNCLADDYQLGNRIARNGGQIALCPVVVECSSGLMGWAAVWKHQLRWARTIRVCQPLPYFFSILSNPSLWPLLWAVVAGSHLSWGFAVFCLALRGLTAADLEKRISRERALVSLGLLASLKDLLQTGIWVLAFAGNRVEWRGVQMRLRSDGTLIKPEKLNAL